MLDIIPAIEFGFVIPLAVVQAFSAMLSLSEHVFNFERGTPTKAEKIS